MTGAVADGRSARRTGLAWLAMLTLAYALLAVAFTWPATARLGRTMLGGPRDGPMFLWNTWWAPEAVGRGEDPLFTRHLFHPDGVDRVLDTHCVLPALLSAPLQAAVGLIAAYDLMVLGTFVIAGLGAALLALELVRDRAAAFVAGAVFAFGHARVSTIMFFNLIQTQLMVLAIWALWRAVARRSKGWAVVAGLCTAALLLSSYNLLVLTLLFLAAFAVATLLQAIWQRRSPVSLLVLFSIAAGAAAVPAAPLLARLLATGEETEYVSLESSKSYQEAVPLRRYLVRGPLHAEGEAGDDEGSPAPIRQASYLGWVAGALVLLGLWHGVRRPAVWFLLATFAVFALLSLGPRVNLAGDSLEGGMGDSLALPFQAVSTWPLLRHVRTAHRYLLVAAVAWSALAAFGAHALLERLRRRWRRDSRGPALVAAVLGLAVVLDYGQWPFPKLHELPPAPAQLYEVARDERDVAVVEFPAGRKGDPAFSWYQTIHGKPVYLDGELARIPPELRERRESSRLLAELGRAFDGEQVPREALAGLRPALQQEVREARIGWVLLSWADHRTLFKEQRPVAAKRLAAMDRLIRRTLAVEERILFRDVAQLEAWQSLDAEARRSASALFAIYRLRLEP